MGQEPRRQAVGTRVPCSGGRGQQNTRAIAAVVHPVRWMLVHPSHVQVGALGITTAGEHSNKADGLIDTELFRAFDTDGNGYLDLNELKVGLKRAMLAAEVAPPRATTRSAACPSSNCTSAVRSLRLPALLPYVHRPLCASPSVCIALCAWPCVWEAGRCRGVSRAAGARRGLSCALECRGGRGGADGGAGGGGGVACSAAQCARCRS